MENIIDSNENTRCIGGFMDTRKVAANNNNNNDSPLSTSPVPTASKAVPRCLGLNGTLSCLNGSNATEPVDFEVDPSPGSQSFDEFTFHNEGLIEEIFLLPHNVISDDEASSHSDNCVYAYRGANMGSPEPQQAPCADDETDFLEMDFEPEPNSEVENFHDEHFNHLEANFFSLQQNLSAMESAEAQLQESKPPKPEQSEPASLEPVPPMRETGAKPKKRTTSANAPSAVVYRSPVVEAPPPVLMRDEFGSPEEGPCLECAEADFLRQTKPELGFEPRCPFHMKAPEKWPSDQLSPALPNPLARLESVPVTAEEPQKAPPREFMVTIYSVGSDYETIVEAINRIGVPVNTEVIKQYFDAQVDEETATMSVPEYLLYVSKRGCNYKKLMELIRLACLEPIDIHFYPVDPLTYAPEIVQIEASEITSRWNPNTDLRQILQFKNRHFRYMNILGKVVYVIRQGDRRRDESPATINIPQYYKSGYICITSKPWP